MASGDEIYSNLNTFTVLSVSADNLDQVTDPLHIQKTNIAALKAKSTIANASGFTPGTPFKGTVSIKQATVTDTGASNAAIVHQPAEGENWKFLSGSVESVTLSTGSGTYYVEVYDATNDNAVQVIRMASTLAGGVPLLNDTESGSAPNEVIYDSESYLRFWANGSFSADPILNFLVVRVV